MADAVVRRLSAEVVRRMPAEQFKSLFLDALN
jgi:hypothetical protein